MINTLRISRFKSIKELALDCRRINIFIGEPNTGKSNILEALGMFSFLRYSQEGYEAREFIRFAMTSDLFYDGDVRYPLEILCDATAIKLEYKYPRFEGVCTVDGQRITEIMGDLETFWRSTHRDLSKIDHFKLYRFRVKEDFPKEETDFLIPPSGDNLLSLLLSNRELMSTVNLPFLSRGLRLDLSPAEGKINVAKQVEDALIAYPYSLTSETLQRLTFHVAAILSNKKSVLVFEEPEAHAFPSYIKHLAELVALDENENQYFIATHNPYFLMPVIEKAPEDDIAVRIVYYEDCETKVKTLTAKEIQESLELDIFGNLERFLEEG